jgi:hypothetical protein
MASNIHVDNRLIEPARQLPLRVLLAPGNPLHAKTMLPVAAELSRRRHHPIFIERDAVIAPDYRVGHLIEASGFEVHRFGGVYKSDQGQVLPSLLAYTASRKSVYEFLDRVPFDVSVSCNDTSALFDRLVVAYSKRRRRECLLIQEGIKQPRRHRTLMSFIRRGHPSKAILVATRRNADRWIPGPYVPRYYGHGGSTMIACAGKIFHDQLIAEGIKEDKLRVTGQPRFDTPLNRSRGRGPHPPHDGRILLYCSQPLQGCFEAARKFFRDLVKACDAMPGVRLLVKLHPRDDPPELLLSQLEPMDGKSLVDVTKDRPLDDCFAQADAMITVASSTCVEAMQASVPVGLIDYFPTNRYLAYDDDAVLRISRADVLADSIKRLLFDSELRERLIENGPRIVRDELYRCDGRSAERIVDFIEERVIAIKGARTQANRVTS